MRMSLEEAQKWVEGCREEPSDKSKQVLAEMPDLGGRVQILWHASYWDGPISGYVTLDGETGYWINMLEDYYNTSLDIDDPEDNSCQECDCATPCITWGRLYAVYKLTEEQERIKLANNALFVQHVGNHCMYGTEPKVDYNDPKDPSPIKLAPGLLPHGTHDLYYKAERPVPPPIEDAQMVGWTTSINPNGWFR